MTLHISLLMIKVVARTNGSSGLFDSVCKFMGEALVDGFGLLDE